MKLRPIVLDFEAEPIQGRPHYPPKPVSFSLQLPEWKVPRFYAWAHRTGGNNTSLVDAKRVLKAAYQRLNAQTPLLCHNGKFDMDVAAVHMGCPLPPWRAFHDTMFLLFLENPHERLLGLKPSAARLLNMPQDERDAVEAWVLEHKRQLEADYPEVREVHGGIKPSNAGAFIAYAPGSIVGPYCIGDVTRTAKLFNLLYERVCVERGMQEAYDRERRLLPILLRNEAEGIRVDVPALERDEVIFTKAQASADAWLRKALKAPGLDLNKDADTAAALKKANAVSEWTQTATGRDSVSKKNLKLSHFYDKKVASAYVYRQKCATNLETFIRPWQRYTHNGWMSTNWNQVRQSKGDRATGGTRTGRPSTDEPNFLNMPKKVRDAAAGGFIMPTHILGLPELPRVRSYILPDEKGHIIGRRDFAQQELRVLAHFEDGELMQAYLRTPDLDVHEFLMQQIKAMFGLDVDRYVTKILNFAYVYGQGLGATAAMLECTVEEVKRFRDAQMRVLPGLKALSAALKQLAKEDKPLRTIGGREYYCEPPAYSERFGKMMSFEYKMLNVLVQGSSADLTKEVLIRYDEARQNGRMILSVYDEVDISVPKPAARKEMLLLRDVMLSLDTDVPMLSDGELGPNLGELLAIKEPKPDLSRWSN